MYGVFDVIVYDFDEFVDFFLDEKLIEDLFDLFCVWYEDVIDMCFVEWLFVNVMSFVMVDVLLWLYV